MRIRSKVSMFFITIISLSMIAILYSCSTSAKSQGYIGQKPVEVSEPFNKEDLVINTLKVGEQSYEDVKATLGDPKSYIDKKSNTVKYDGMVLTFKDKKLSEIQIEDSTIDGPRGIQIGDSIDTVIRKFPMRAYDEKNTGMPQILYTYKETGTLQMPFGVIEFKDKNSGVINYWFCFSGEGRSLQDKNEPMGNLMIGFRNGKVSSISIFAGKIEN